MSISIFPDKGLEEKPFKTAGSDWRIDTGLKADVLIKVRDTNDNWQICRALAQEGRCPIGNRKSAIEN
jgi:hypothetical protein